jgi:hypothetical protein
MMLDMHLRWTPHLEPNVAASRGTMKPAKATMMKLLDRSLIGLLIFVVMLLLGMNAVQTG